MEKKVETANDLQRALLLRRTYRDFLPRPVETETAEAILDAARWAPSWANRQPWRIVYIEETQIKEALTNLEEESKAVSSHWVPMFRSTGIRDHIQDFAGSPFVAAVFADPEGAEPNQHGNHVHVLGAAAALQNMYLTAAAYGLGGVLVTNFIEEKLKALLNVPWQWPFLGILCCGYVDPDANIGKTYEVSLRRLPLDRIAFSEEYDSDVNFGEGVRQLPEEMGRTLLYSPTSNGKRSWADALETAIRQRRSTSNFSNQNVPDEAIQQILTGAQWAPSAGNQQPWRFVLVRDPDTRAYLEEVHKESIDLFAHWEAVYGPDSPWSEPHQFSATPLSIALISDPTKGGPHVDNRFSATVGCGLALQNMQLAAHAAGLGSRFVSTFIPEKVKKRLDVPRTLDMLGVLAVGYSDDEPSAPPRASLREVGFLNRAPTPLTWDVIGKNA